LTLFLANAVTLGLFRSRSFGYVSGVSSVTFDPNVDGGTVTLLDPLPSNYVILLRLAPDEPILDFTFRNQTNYTLKAIENAFGWVMGAIQRLTDNSKRSVRLPEQLRVSNFDTVLPDVTAGAGKFIGINDNGDGLELKSADAAAGLSDKEDRASQVFSDLAVTVDPTTNIRNYISDVIDTSTFTLPDPATIDLGRSFVFYNFTGGFSEIFYHDSTTTDWGASNGYPVSFKYVNPTYSIPSEAWSIEVPYTQSVSSDVTLSISNALAAATPPANKNIGYDTDN